METYHGDVVAYFVWELQETSWRRTNGTSWRRIIETSWWRTTETSLGVSFETYLRSRGDVLMRRRHYVPLRRCQNIPIRRHEDVPLRRLGDVPLRRRWVFHLRSTCNVAETYKEMSLRRRHDVSLADGPVALEARISKCSVYFMILLTFFCFLLIISLCFISSMKQFLVLCVFFNLHSWLMLSSVIFSVSVLYYQLNQLISLLILLL